MPTMSQLTEEKEEEREEESRGREELEESGRPVKGSVAGGGLEVSIGEGEKEEEMSRLGSGE